MATWSEAELATEVLKKLRIVGTGQSADADDLERVTTPWVSIHAYLRRHGRAPWAIGEVPEEAQTFAADYVAGRVAHHFGITGPRWNELAMVMKSAWSELGELYAAERTSTPIRPSYF